MPAPSNRTARASLRARHVGSSPRSSPGKVAGPTVSRAGPEAITVAIDVADLEAQAPRLRQGEGGDHGPVIGEERLRHRLGERAPTRRNEDVVDLPHRSLR